MTVPELIKLIFRVTKIKVEVVNQQYYFSMFRVHGLVDGNRELTMYGKLLLKIVGKLKM